MAGNRADGADAEPKPGPAQRCRDAAGGHDRRAGALATDAVGVGCITHKNRWQLMRVNWVWCAALNVTVLVGSYTTTPILIKREVRYIPVIAGVLEFGELPRALLYRPKGGLSLEL